MDRKLCIVITPTDWDRGERENFILFTLQYNLNCLPSAGANFKCFNNTVNKYPLSSFTLRLSRSDTVTNFHQWDKKKDMEALFLSFGVNSKTIGAISGTFGCTAGTSGGLSMSPRAPDTFIIPPLRVECGSSLSMINYQPRLTLPGTKGEGRKSALQVFSADFTLFPWKSCGCFNSCPQAGTACRRGSYSSKWR